MHRRTLLTTVPALLLLATVPALAKARYLPGERSVVVEHDRPPRLSLISLGRGASGTPEPLVGGADHACELLDALPGLRAIVHFGAGYDGTEPRPAVLPARSGTRSSSGTPSRPRKVETIGLSDCSATAASASSSQFDPGNDTTPTFTAPP